MESGQWELGKRSEGRRGRKGKFEDPHSLVYVGGRVGQGKKGVRRVKLTDWPDQNCDFTLFN